MDSGTEEGCRKSSGDDAMRSLLGLAGFSDASAERACTK